MKTSRSIDERRGAAKEEAARSLEAIRRPLARDLSVPELVAFAADLAARPEVWLGHVEHDPAQRYYAELVSDAHLTAWLICWMDDHDTGFHDHDSSAGAVAVVSGRVREQRLVLDGEPAQRVFAAGQAFGFSPADIHRVFHEGSDPAVTLHVYSPPLLRMGAYYVDERGVLARFAMSPTDELRPLTGAGSV
jgi:hypothetical protein